MCTKCLHLTCKLQIVLQKHSLHRCLRLLPQKHPPDPTDIAQTHPLALARGSITRTPGDIRTHGGTAALTRWNSHWAGMRKWTWTDIRDWATRRRRTGGHCRSCRRCNRTPVCILHHNWTSTDCSSFADHALNPSIVTSRRTTKGSSSSCIRLRSSSTKGSIARAYGRRRYDRRGGHTI